MTIAIRGQFYKQYHTPFAFEDNFTISILGGPFPKAIHRGTMRTESKIWLYHHERSRHYLYFLCCAFLHAIASARMEWSGMLPSCTVERLVFLIKVFPVVGSRTVLDSNGSQVPFAKQGSRLRRSNWPNKVRSRDDSVVDLYSALLLRERGKGKRSMKKTKKFIQWSLIFKS